MTTENMVRYNVNQINEIISILDSISTDTKAYSGLSLILAISEINRILHCGEIYENTATIDSDDAPESLPNN